jgi:hypothetical protein
MIFQIEEGLVHFGNRTILYWNKQFVVLRLNIVFTSGFNTKCAIAEACLQY